MRTRDRLRHGSLTRETDWSSIRDDIEGLPMNTQHISQFVEQSVGLERPADA